MIKPILFSACTILLSSCKSNTSSSYTDSSNYRKDYSAPESNVSMSKDTLFRFESESDSLVGFKDRKGMVKIPASYKMSFSEVIVNYGFVMNAKNDLVGIDRNGKFLYNAYFFDNGPDYIECNRFRITKNEKVGFANGETGAIEILPEFSYADPFSENLAVFCLGGKSESDGEHSWWTGGKWGVIDLEGKVIVEPIYTSIDFYKNGKANAVLNGKKVQLDKTGKQI